MADQKKFDLADWTEFKKSFKKSYEAEEDSQRMKIFLETKKMVEEHNEKFKRGETTYEMGLNEFSDWFPEERSKLCGLRVSDDGRSTGKRC